jgi:hypothetical protein
MPRQCAVELSIGAAQAVSIAGLSRAYETSAARRPVLAVFLSDL